MEQGLAKRTDNTVVALKEIQDQKSRNKIQNFVNKLNSLPDPQSIDKTPDGKAATMVISYMEMTLDEYFFGLWSTENFKWSVIANEVVGSLDLICTHPVTGKDIRRVGAACIQIMVDKRPDNVNPSEWANNPANKKPNALDMGFPKLKAECLKNAAQSLGKLFGRDLNRKKQDIFQPLVNTNTLDERIKVLLLDCMTCDELEAYKNEVPANLRDFYNERYDFLNPAK